MFIINLFKNVIDLKAMYMSSITSPAEHQNAEEILLKIGHLFQAQDDYLDCWGDPAIIGKIGTDIEACHHCNAFL